MAVGNLEEIIDDQHAIVSTVCYQVKKIFLRINLECWK
jgi:hypothetical protein